MMCKSTRRKFRVIRRRLLVWATVYLQILLLMCHHSVALAEGGGTVVAGSANINHAGNSLTVNQASDRAIINWNGFSIPAGHSATFNLPSSSSAVLNRVTGADPSAIHGSLQSNGQVFLINPNGILVGPNANINVGDWSLRR